MTQFKRFTSRIHHVHRDIHCDFLPYWGMHKTWNTTGPASLTICGGQTTKNQSIPQMVKRIFNN